MTSGKGPWSEPWAQFYRGILETLQVTAPHWTRPGDRQRSIYFPAPSSDQLRDSKGWGFRSPGHLRLFLGTGEVGPSSLQAVLEQRSVGAVLLG